jgi:hypothetical protein
VIGPKKLITIREELKSALTATGDDPIVWLEKRMSEPTVRVAGTSGKRDVLGSLIRFLDDARREKRVKNPTVTRKWRQDHAATTGGIEVAVDAHAEHEKQDFGCLVRSK